jgi:hypothetical protein
MRSPCRLRVSRRVKEKPGECRETVGCGIRVAYEGCDAELGAEVDRGIDVQLFVIPRRSWGHLCAGVHKAGLYTGAP